ncbi:MAG: hypothetical protein HY692_09970, partial [Cyanobacteria bacterium NC_groundwater_1444_Ag_S-0.65um_54_12]|nr:hypothetical protein [Cyanobacteria bacterium NC_groundwater_1444_Ag_S-0.65um_54_12]
MSDSFHDLLTQEKRVRGKTVLDPQMDQMLQHLRNLGIETVWDVQAAYDSDLLGLKDRCSFGTRGVCCRNCAMGPCRLATEDMPRHMKAVSPVLNRSTCGKTADSMVASMFLSTALRGAASHLSHAYDVATTFYKVAEEETNGNYELRDIKKLHALAGRLGIMIEGLEDKAIAREIARVIQEDFTGGFNLHEQPMRFFAALAPKRHQRLIEAGLVPQRGVVAEIMKFEHATAQGMMSNTFELLRASLRLGMYDAVGLFMATELQDVLLGTPKPGFTSMGMDNLKAEKVNIVVHGHNPLFSEKLVDVVDEMEQAARQA